MILTCTSLVRRTNHFLPGQLHFHVFPRVYVILVRYLLRILPVSYPISSPNIRLVKNQLTNKPYHTLNNFPHQTPIISTKYHRNSIKSSLSYSTSRSGAIIQEPTPYVFTVDVASRVLNYTLKRRKITVTDTSINGITSMSRREAEDHVDERIVNENYLISISPFN